MHDWCMLADMGSTIYGPCVFACGCEESGQSRPHIAGSKYDGLTRSINKCPADLRDNRRHTLRKDRVVQGYLSQLVVCTPLSIEGCQAMYPTC